MSRSICLTACLCAKSKSCLLSSLGIYLYTWKLQLTHESRNEMLSKGVNNSLVCRGNKISILTVLIISSPVLLLPPLSCYMTTKCIQTFRVVGLCICLPTARSLWGWCRGFVFVLVPFHPSTWVFLGFGQKPPIMTKKQTCQPLMMNGPWRPGALHSLTFGEKKKIISVMSVMILLSSCGHPVHKLITCCLFFSFPLLEFIKCGGIVNALQLAKRV